MLHYNKGPPKLLGSDDVHYNNRGGSVDRYIHVSKFIALYTLKICYLLYVSYTSMNL